MNEWYLYINANIKEGVNFINFHSKVPLHTFCWIIPNRDFLILKYSMWQLFIEFYESGTLWKVAVGWHIYWPDFYFLILCKNSTWQVPVRIRAKRYNFYPQNLKLRPTFKIQMFGTKSKFQLLIFKCKIINGNRLASNNIVKSGVMAEGSRASELVGVPDSNPAWRCFFVFQELDGKLYLMVIYVR